MRIDSFTAAYIEAALWSSTDESDDRGGEPLDRNYTAADIAPDTLARMVADCEAFQREHGDAIIAADRGQPAYPPLASAGHDLWLTRNGHGCGFWDGDWPEPLASALTASAKAMGGSISTSATTDAFMPLDTCRAHGYVHGAEDNMERQKTAPGDMAGWTAGDLAADMQEAIIIRDNPHGGWDVEACGKSIARRCLDMDAALAVVVQWMEANAYWPSVYRVNDHGNVDLIDSAGNLLGSWV